MIKQFDTLVFCGRFQPFHIGHQSVIDQALLKAHEVVIVIGSSFQARSTKNPFTFSERAAMIRAVYTQDNVKIVGVMDYPYDDNAWVSAVQSAVDAVKSESKTGLVGHSKDSSSYYLKIFPQWSDHIEVANVGNINATDIRKAMLEFGIFRGIAEFYSDTIPEEVNYVIDDIVRERSHESWELLVQEYAQIQSYKNAWKAAPYEPTFVTTDAVITQGGYVLLIKRGGFPFKDCWALPGGYLAKSETIVDNMIKELREETCVKIPAKVLKGSIKDVKIFDHPDRDPRGRTITHGFHVDLGFPIEGLPKVKGADDAKEAKWVLLSKINSEMMAFDHYAIITSFIRI
jgi:bifunctional NMN adenylyltransferase/nudix hydrolase